MGCYTALIAFLFILHTVNGQTTTATPPSSTTDPPLSSAAPQSRRCSSVLPLCCTGLNNSCFRGCYCDVACLRFRDCCPDFQTTCVTGVQDETSLSATVSPVSNATNATNATIATSTSFPVFSFPDIQTVIGSLKISILAPSNSTDASLEVSIQKAALQLQVYLKATYSEISSFRIIKLKKTGKT
ncbi:hypothetical protein J4Q44_G00204820 [Coregonus suidteri]|uniref:SMB domain-containing protein n=1 Tax=Coregonus suidteri TaxID=861788 RepID=A0AAN8QKE5_9TELE